MNAKFFDEGFDFTTEFTLINWVCKNGDPVSEFLEPILKHYDNFLDNKKNFGRNNNKSSNNNKKPKRKVSYGKEKT